MSNQPHPLAIAEGVLFEACATTGIYPQDLRAKTRKAIIAQTRQAVMYAIRKRVGTGISLPIIAKFMGLGDHTTVKHALEIVPERMERDEVLRDFVAKLMAAAPIVPTTVLEELVRAGIPRTKLHEGMGAAKMAWNGTPRITRGTLKPRAFKRAPVAAPPPPPPPPKVQRFKPYDEDGEATILLDDEGRDYSELIGEERVRVASADLCEAILTARASA